MGRVNYLGGYKSKNRWQAEHKIKGRRYRRCYATEEEANAALEQMKQGIIPPTDYKGPKSTIPVSLLRPYWDKWRKRHHAIWTEGKSSGQLPDGVSNWTAQLILEGTGKIGFQAADKFLSAVGEPHAWHCDEELSKHYV